LALPRLPPPYGSHYGVVPAAPPAVLPSTIPVADRYLAATNALVRDYALCLDAVIQEARHHGPSIFTDDLIRDLHRSVMKEDSAYRDTPGELRTKVVWVGGREPRRVHSIASADFASCRNTNF
jgi:hypothetical protein